MKINIFNKLFNSSRIFIIAEAGVNHNGDMKLAKKLIDCAFLAGCDAIKFQTFKAENLVTQSAAQAKYQKENSPNKSQFEMLKKVELSEDNFIELFKYCRAKGIMFLSTPFDSESARFLNKLGMPIFKVSSGEVTNIPFLIQVASFKKPVILSTGMSTLKEVKEAVHAIYSTGNKKLILLHCTSNYPASFKDVNLKAMDTLRTVFNVPVGYSDHTLEVEVALAAVARGAFVIEKHITLDKTLPGPDHKASLDIDELKALVKMIRNIEVSLGDGVKAPVKSEAEVARVIRKSVVAGRNILPEEKLSWENLIIKRPGNGINPKEIYKLIGKLAKREIKKDRLIKWSDVK
ncbi:MAG: N-acetylneuraminate synthase [Candidatus Omnitrophica bacterium]|nr:N-acetylneuraminate synthase [Candidatus Omnitrophota bacterium]